MNITLHENITGYLQDNNILQNYPSSAYGMVFESENGIAAYLYYSKNLYHPDAIYLHFAILDKDIDSEILIKMYDKFKSVLPRSIEILQIQRKLEFYERLINENGFTEFRKTYEPEVDIQQLIKRFLNEDSEGKHTSGKFKMTDALLKITEQVYRSIHEMNPLKRMDLSEWKDIITDDLDFEHSIIIYDRNDEIIAYLMMYENEEPFKDVGYCYFKNQEAKNSLSAEFHDTLLELEKQNFTHLNLEVDNTDIYAYEFFHDFIEHDPPSLISYMKTENK